MQDTISSEVMTLDKVILLFKETDKKFQETDRQMKETDKKFQETEKIVQETSRQMKETDRQMKNLMKKMSESENRWGKFVEALVEGSLVSLLQKRNIEVDKVFQRAKKNYQNQQYEIDLIAVNGKELVAVEVKTTLSPEDVKDFIKKLKIFKKLFNEWENKLIYGGVAYINESGNAASMAEKQGLFVIKATGESGRIINEKTFKPNPW